MSYDTRAFGDFGWQFVNAGELFRRLDGVSQEEQLMICGIFKQATMGDCQVEGEWKTINFRNEMLWQTSNAKQTLNSSHFLKHANVIYESEAKKCEKENLQRSEWLKHKGMDTFEAMQLYIEKVTELAKVHKERPEDS